MTFEVKIPPAGEGVTEVMVQRWEKQVGEQVRAGWLLRRLAAEGEVVPVGAAVAVLGESPAAG